MLEKRLIAVPPQALAADGGTDGSIIVADTSLFKVKQEVILTATSLPNLDNVEIKRINGPTQMVVGPKNGNILATTNVSAYTVALNASIFANEQKRPSIPLEEIVRAVYEEEPTVAIRTIPVDEFGNEYTESNRFPVDATISLTPVKPDQHHIFNVNVSTAGVEQVVLLPAGTEIFSIMVRSNKAIKLQYTFTAGESGTKFITIMPGVRKEFSGVGFNLAKPLYFQLSSTDVGGTIVEVEAWT